ncbi:MAG: TRAP transporter small permease [Pirellulaceae bacterium]
MFVPLITKAGRAIQRVEEAVLSGAILVIAGLTILNVICRSVFGFSLAFTEEVSQFCIIIVCFVGLGYAASKGRHIRMTAIYDQLPPATRKVFMVVITISTALLMFTLSWYALRYVVTVHELGGIYPALRVPFYLVYAIAPVGLFLAGVQYGLAAVRNLISKDIYLSFEMKDEYAHPVTPDI